MKKSLIALAALAAVGAASAQSSVTLYGLIDAGYSWAEHTAKVPGFTVKTTETGFTSGNLSGSRWGLKGQEDLGNGLAAVFNVEAGFDSINGDFTTGFNRRSVVGLKGSFGQVVVGRDYTPIDDLASGKYQAIDSFSYDNLGGYYLPGPDLYTDRYNGIHYTGEFSGVSVKAFAGYDETKTEINGVLVGSKVKGHGVGLGLGYASGAFSIDGAVQHFDGVLSAKNTEFGVGASYDFGPAKLMGHYLGNKVENWPTFQQFGLGVTAPFGAATLGAQYAYNRGKTPFPMFGATKVSGHDFGVIANYALSKRTDLYARAMRANSWKGGVEKYYSDSLTFGIRHRF